jgi:hypothetical protein
MLKRVAPELILVSQHVALYKAKEMLYCAWHDVLCRLNNYETNFRNQKKNK